MDDLKYYIDGPGEVLITTSDFIPGTPDVNKIICNSTCKNASFRGTVTMENVTGGRSLSPRRQFMTAKDLTFEMDDCQMDFRYTALAVGESIAEGAIVVSAFGDDEMYEVPSSGPYTFDLSATPTAGSLVITMADGSMGSEEATPSSTGDFKVSGKTVTMSAADAGVTVKAMFTYTSGATAKTVSNLSTSIPKTVKIVHKQPVFDEDNIKIGTQYIVIYKAQVSAELEKAYAERAAYAPKMSFAVLDDGRADQKLVDEIYVPAA